MFLINISKWNTFCQNICYRHYSSINTTSNSLKYCLNSVQKHDLENFLCTLLLPQNLRAFGIALRAFNVEIATVQDQVSENIIGLMRFKFWEDTIDKLYEGKIPEHPVCQELAQVINTKKVSKIYLKRLILSRQNYLTSSNFSSLKDAEDYSEFSNSSLYYMLLELADIKQIDSDHAASHLGKAQGLTNLIRSVPYHSKKRKIALPQDLLLKYNVSHENIYRCHANKNVKDVIFEIATKIYQHIEKMKQLQKKVDKISRLIYLPVVPVNSYLKNLRSVDFDVFHPKLQQKNHMLSLKLLWKKMLL